jgi:hypothetical protein
VGTKGFIQQPFSLKGQGHSIKHRIAVGPHKGRQAFKLQGLPPLTGDRAGETLATAAGFSLPAGVATEAHQRNTLERVARYITRPPVAIERLSLTPEGNIRYALSSPFEKSWPMWQVPRRPRASYRRRAVPRAARPICSVSNDTHATLTSPHPLG